MTNAHNPPVTETHADSALKARLDTLSTARIENLRAQYRELFKTDPPSAFGPDLLRRSIAYRLQEDAFGGLSKPTRRLLDQLIARYLANPSGKTTAPRRIKPGSILVREWKGAPHHVTVLEEGFAWRGTIWSSLSIIAREITGTRWNGPRFFGLRAHDIPETSGTGRKPLATAKTQRREAPAPHVL